MGWGGSLTSGQVTSTKRGAKDVFITEKTDASVEEQQRTTSLSQEEQQQQTQQKAVQDILQQTQTEQLQTGTKEAVSEITGTTEARGTEEQSALTRLLGGETQASIESLVQNLLASSGEAGTDLSNIVDLITQRAGEGGVAAGMEDIISAARLSGEKELQALETQLAQQAGGSLANLGVAAGTAEGRASLESQLAALRGQLKMEARGVESQELQQALEAVQQQTGIAVPLLDILKGAEAEQIGTTTTAQQTEQAQQAKTSEQTTSEILANVIAQTLGTTQTDTISSILARATTEQESQLTKLLEEIKTAETKERTRAGETERNIQGSVTYM